MGCRELAQVAVAARPKPGSPAARRTRAEFRVGAGGVAALRADLRKLLPTRFAEPGARGIFRLAIGAAHIVPCRPWPPTHPLQAQSLLVASHRRAGSRLAVPRRAVWRGADCRALLPCDRSCRFAHAVAPAADASERRRMFRPRHDLPRPRCRQRPAALRASRVASHRR